MGNLNDGNREEEMQKEEDVLFIPPDMKHSSTLNWEEDDQRAIYSALGIDMTKEGTTHRNPNLRTGAEAPERRFSQRSSSSTSEAQHKKKHGLFARFRGKPMKSTWRIESDKKKAHRPPEKEIIEPVMPAIILNEEVSQENDDPIPRRRRMSVLNELKEGVVSNEGVEWQDNLGAAGFHVDDVTRFLIARGIMGLKGSELELIEEDNTLESSFSRLIPQEYREYLTRLMNPVERKKMLREIYKTGIVRASCWMVGLFLVLYLMPDSRFLAPFIAGFVGGKKAGSTLKAFAAAITPFFILGILQILLLFHFIYPFYDIYSPTAGALADYLTMKLTVLGMDPAGMNGLASWSNLGRAFIYMAVGAVIGGTLESDVIKRGVKTIDLLQITTISDKFQRKI